MGTNRRYPYDELPSIRPRPRKELPRSEVRRISHLLTRLLQSIRPGDDVDLRRLGRVQADVREGYIRCEDVWWVKQMLARFGIG